MTIKIYYKNSKAVHIVNPERVDGSMRDYVDFITAGDFKKWEVIK